uniref:Uncharacterized protein n=1 Tax=Anguilla anguilla TaxID=7936 RepID=A0A0E9TS52_ANGAN
MCTNLSLPQTNPLTRAYCRRVGSSPVGVCQSFYGHCTSLLLMAVSDRSAS